MERTDPEEMSKESNPGTQDLNDDSPSRATYRTIDSLLSKLRGIKSQNVTHEPNNETHAVVEFISHQQALTMLVRLKDIFSERAGITANWATGPGIQPKQPQAITIKFSDQLLPNYGLPNYSRAQMDAHIRELIKKKVTPQGSPTDPTVHCGGFTNGLTEYMIRKIFSQFGLICDCIVFDDASYALIEFNTRDEATRAIEATNNTVINGSTVNCSWKMEDDDSNSIEYTDNQPVGFLHIGDKTYPVGANNSLVIGEGDGCNVRLPSGVLFKKPAKKLSCWGDYENTAKEWARIDLTQWGITLVDLDLTRRKTFIDEIGHGSQNPYFLTKDSNIRFGDVEATFTIDPEFVPLTNLCLSTIPYGRQVRYAIEKIGKKRVEARGESFEMEKISIREDK